MAKAKAEKGSAAKSSAAKGSAAKGKAAKHNAEGLEGLVERLQELRKEAGNRLKELLDDAHVRERLQSIQDGIDDLRHTIERRLRGEPAKPLEEMTVKELRHLATEREIAGRSSMSKAELVKALRRAG